MCIVKSSFTYSPVVMKATSYRSDNIEILFECMGCNKKWRCLIVEVELKVKQKMINVHASNSNVSLDWVLTGYLVSIFWIWQVRKSKKLCFISKMNLDFLLVSFLILKHCWFFNNLRLKCIERFYVINKLWRFF